MLSILVSAVQDRTMIRSAQFSTCRSTQTECHIAEAPLDIPALTDSHSVPEFKNGKLLPPLLCSHQESSIEEVILSKSGQLPEPLGTAICTGVESESSQLLFDRATISVKVWTVR